MPLDIVAGVMLAQAAAEGEESYVEAYIVPGWVGLLAVAALLAALVVLLFVLRRRARQKSSAG